MKKVGIMGGTFNPIHVGHLMLAENAYAFCGLDEIWFMPSADPPHKTNQNVLEYHHRSQMTELAIEFVPYFKLSNFETLRRNIVILQKLCDYYMKNIRIQNFIL